MFVLVMGVVSLASGEMLEATVGTTVMRPAVHDHATGDLCVDIFVHRETYPRR